MTGSNFAENLGIGDEKETLILFNEHDEINFVDT